jgi:hypothetical protein
MSAVVYPRKARPLWAASTRAVMFCRFRAVRKKRSPLGVVISTLPELRGLAQDVAVGFKLFQKLLREDQVVPVGLKAAIVCRLDKVCLSGKQNAWERLLRPAVGL